MPIFDDKHVKLCGGILVWDGVTQPEQVTQGQQAGKLKYSLKAVFEPHNPDIALFEQLSQKALMESKWRGQLPAGGRMPIGFVQPGEFNDMFPGYRVISFKTTLKQPDVYDENGGIIDPMRFSAVIYGGQKVDVLAHCYEYDAAGNKGISAGLDAFAVIESAQMPRQQFGNGINTASAFGQGAAQTAGAPSNPNLSGQSGYANGATAYPSSQAAPQYGAPQQAHNFLPQGQQGGAPGPGGPAPAPQTQAISYRTPDGRVWTEQQLIAAGWQPVQIQALPRA